MGSLGALLACLGFLVGSHLLSWGSLGLHLVLSGSLGLSWGSLGALLGSLGALLGSLGALLGLSWGSLGALLGSLGAPSGSLGHSWVCLGLSQGFQASSATLASRFPQHVCDRQLVFVSIVVGSCLVDLT